MNKTIKSLLLPFGISFAFAMPLALSIPSAQAATPRPLVHTAQGTYKCHKAGVLGRKLSCTRVRATTKR